MWISYENGIDSRKYQAMLKISGHAENNTGLL